MAVMVQAAAPAMSGTTAAPARLSLPRARFRMPPAHLRARLVRHAKGPARNGGRARAHQLDIVGAS